jgi:RimJ/RimL family protein N-acetyltransferase
MPDSRVVRTERFVLRPFRPDDVEAIARYARDEDYRRYLSPTHPAPAEFVAHNVGVDWSVQRSWVITLDDEILGSVFLGINSEDDAAELTCLVDPRSWGMEIGVEACRAAVEHAFVELALAKVVARTDPRNASAIGLMEKLGMQRDGSTSTDEVLYAIRRGDWSLARSDAR